MEAKIENVLREAAREATALDGDIVRLPIFADLVERVTCDGNAVTGADDAVKAMRERKPALFKESDWREMAPDRYDD